MSRTPAAAATTAYISLPLSDLTKGTPSNKRSLSPTPSQTSSVVPEAFNTSSDALAVNYLSRRPAQNSRQRQELQGVSTSVGAMSFVGLKNIFFQRTITPVTQRKFDSKTIDKSLSHDSTVESDLESQASNQSSAKEERKAFRIDARVISDATIGLSDGLTVPFALTAGLSALGSTKVVIYGGLAELIAGAISMGLGGYLGAKSEAASYKAQKEEAEAFIANDPRAVMRDLKEVFAPFNLPRPLLHDVAAHLSESPRLIDFIMKFQHCAEEPAASRAFTSAITIALGYFLGGLLPLIPYFCVAANQVYTGLYISIGVMVAALFIFGYGKTCIVTGWTGGKNIRDGCFGGVQMVIVGSVAAGAAMGLVRAFNQEGLSVS